MFGSLVTYLVERSATGLLRDALDIAIVYYACYRALLVLRGTRAMQVGIGLLLVLVLYFVARVLELVTVLSIMGTFLSSLLLIIVVVFQNDIRRGLQRIGSGALFARFTRGPETKVIDEVVEAATELARHRVGALIAFEQDANLDEFVGAHKGHEVDARVSRELLVSLFVPEGINKLHDGAVIIRNLRVAKAGVFFPMPEQRVVDQSFGSRHRAALGITEETDAVVVAVSEERGTISFCFNGNIASNLDGPKLRTMLEAVFSPKAAQKRAAASRRASVVTVTPVSLSEGRTEGPEASRSTTSRSELGDVVTTRTRQPAEGETTLMTRSKTGAEPRPQESGDEPRLVRASDSDRPPPPALRRRGMESEPPLPLRSRAGVDEPNHITQRDLNLLSAAAVPHVAMVPRDTGPLTTPLPKRLPEETEKEPASRSSRSGEGTT